MITRDDLTALGFKETFSVFNGKNEWTLGTEVTDICGAPFKSPIVYYDIDTQRCRTIRHEFSSVSKVCDSIDLVKKFIECVSFLYDLKIE